jgi:hypothetical protein
MSQTPVVDGAGHGGAWARQWMSAIWGRVHRHNDSRGSGWTPRQIGAPLPPGARSAWLVAVGKSTSSHPPASQGSSRRAPSCHWPSPWEAGGPHRSAAPTPAGLAAWAHVWPLAWPPGLMSPALPERAPLTGTWVHAPPYTTCQTQAADHSTPGGSLYSKRRPWGRGVRPAFALVEPAVGLGALRR